MGVCDRHQHGLGRAGGDRHTYLAQAGPAGSVLGLALGAVIMGIVALNYACLMRSYPDAGGAYAYTREVFG